MCVSRIDEANSGALATRAVCYSAAKRTHHVHEEERATNSMDALLLKSVFKNHGYNRYNIIID